MQNNRNVLSAYLPDKNAYIELNEINNVFFNYCVDKTINKITLSNLCSNLDEGIKEFNKCLFKIREN